MDLLSFNLATINIANINSPTKIDALNSFLRLNEIDIVFLQEVENASIQLTGNSIVFNIDNRNRGVAIAHKLSIEYTAVQNSLDGRLIMITLKNGDTLCNIYAPTGAQNRASREDFFNFTCSHYLRNCTGPIIFGGDFNSVVNPRYASGATSRSNMTSRLMSSLDLIDVWGVLHRNETDYTFVRAGSSSRLDRILVSRSSTSWLRTINHSVTCFSDHKVVLTRMVLPGGRSSI